ncbi:hypothetical protein B0H17DRAFT_1139079 [Mycena rosella]|uniref:Uncharacterized protein n=1 Tax=Mycena rosella TaxID=1033263 RepID=A0AAD7D4Z6_MYCRO|nr:hypothetical protein B0H17DRAFT_1139079 [Mycena rosella]
MQTNRRCDRCMEQFLNFGLNFGMQTRWVRTGSFDIPRLIRCGKQFRCMEQLHADQGSSCRSPSLLLKHNLPIQHLDRFVVDASSNAVNQAPGTPKGADKKLDVQVDGPGDPAAAGSEVVRMLRDLWGGSASCSVSARNIELVADVHPAHGRKRYGDTSNSPTPSRTGIPQSTHDPNELLNVGADFASLRYAICVRELGVDGRGGLDALGDGGDVVDEGTRWKHADADKE